MSRTIIWPTLRYDDAHAAIRFLTDAFGFEQVALYESGELVDHCEMRWPSGGGVMLGSTARVDSSIAGLPPGMGSVYVVTDDPDGLYKRSTSAGATVVAELRDEDYGSRGFTVRDPEGVYWSFGTYGGVQD